MTPAAMRSIWDGLSRGQLLQTPPGELSRTPMTDQTGLRGQVFLLDRLPLLLAGTTACLMCIPKFFFILFLTSVCSAESTKMLFNPFTQKLDYITRIDTGTVISGSSFRTSDSNSCLWDISVSTPGNLVTTLVSCPTIASFVACVPGVPYGALLTLVCPRP